MEIKKAAVLGFGTMGSEIAALLALAGIETVCFDPFKEAFTRNMPRIEAFVQKQRKLTDEEKAQAMGRLTTTCHIDDTKGADVVIEASLEVLDVKKKLLNELGAVADGHTIVATNTSSMSISELASMYKYPNRFLGLHFFNPATTMTLVEVVPGMLTDDDTFADAFALVERLGKNPVKVKETPGFVVNRILIALMFEAVELLEQGIATMDDIDIAMRRGAGFPLGPFKLADLVGLDVLLHAGEVLYAELGNDKFKPPYLLKKMVSAGYLGKKSGRGFYDYSKEGE